MVGFTKDDEPSDDICAVESRLPAAYLEAETVS
jgi:hypothetical protein